MLEPYKQLEEWWLNIAYLEYRDPCALFVNPGIVTPGLNFKGVDDQLRWVEIHCSDFVLLMVVFLPTDTLLS